MFADCQHLLHDGQVMFQFSCHRGQLRRFQTEEPVDIAHGILGNSCKYLFGLRILIECIIKLTRRKCGVIQRHVFRWQYFHTLVEHVQCFLVLTFFQQVFGQLIEQGHTVALTHTHHVLVDINARFVYATPFELVHHIIIHLFRVRAFVSILRHDLISQTSLFKVTVQANELVGVYGDCVIDRTFPIVRLQHIQDHQFLLAQCVLSFQVDRHFLQ